MHPEIMPGDILQIEIVRPEKLRVGDIALFQKDDKLIAHRIVHIDNRQNILVEKGDSKFMPYQINFDSVKGRVIAVERNGQKIVLKGVKSTFRSYCIAAVSYYKYKFVTFLSKIKRSILRGNS